MTQRTFELRLSSLHDNPDNTLKKLEVQVLADGEWEPRNLTDAAKHTQLQFV